MVIRGHSCILLDTILRKENTMVKPRSVYVVIRIPQHLVYRQPGKRMSRKKVRAGHRGLLTGVLPSVDECLNNYEVEKKVELAKWHTVLKEQLDKTMPLDEEI